jgi:uncharacterized protein YjbI with pentapeptide repeats
MSEQDGKQVTALQHLQRPTTDDPKAWKVYWKGQGQPWRLEPEIDIKRQQFLAERRGIPADIEQGIYPFKEIKLGRADVEWLLATHENGRGPVDWSDESQPKREGLDLRGADLQGEDLSGLPQACMQGGLTQGSDWNNATTEQRETAAVHLEGANLRGSNLEGAMLNKAHLEGTDLRSVHLEGATLNYTHLEGRTMLIDSQRQVLKNIQIALPPANLREVFFDTTTHLELPTLGNEKSGFISLADVRWGGTNLAVIDWSLVNMLGDESKALRQHRLIDYRQAVRANRQLAVALQTQGLNEIASRFAYRAQKLQRVVFRRQRKFGQYLFSGFLDLLAGYGYRPGRSVFWYFVMIFGFALSYVAFGHLPLLPDALVFSLTSFHGRGFFPGLGNEITLHNPLVVLAATEAVIGLFIEISFIATFTRRFFGS